MEFNKKIILIDKDLNELDKFVLRFIKILEKYCSYVIVSGYVSIVLGRSRASEDIDLLVPDINREKFDLLFNNLFLNGFECINTSKEGEAFEMFQEHAIRFSELNKAIPNIEFKKIKTELGKYSYENKISVVFGKERVYISPLELQIAYKLFLGRGGNEKDIEDAKHIYALFSEKLNKEELIYFINKLKVKKSFDKYLK